MEPNRIFITGANGFVGRHLIAELLKRYGSQVSIIAGIRAEDVDQPANTIPGAGWTGRAEPDITIAPIDIRSAKEAADAIERAQPDCIVHLAARSSSADVDRDDIIAVNVAGTRNVLEGASLLSPFPRTLIVSSGYVYGSTDPGRPAREDDPIGPLWRYGPYTDSKIEMESVARNYRGFAMIARPFAHTGPGQTPSFAAPGFARQLARIENGLDAPVLRVGNVSASRDLLDVRDVVRAYIELLLAGQPGAVYNIATGQPVQIGHVLDRLRELCRVPTEVEVDPARLRAADIECSSGDSARLAAATRWTPRISLDTTLSDTLNYWRSAI